MERNTYRGPPRKDQGREAGETAYAAGEVIAAASAAALMSMRSGMLIVILPSRSS